MAAIKGAHVRTAGFARRRGRIASAAVKIAFSLALAFSMVPVSFAFATGAEGAEETSGAQGVQEDAVEGEPASPSELQEAADDADVPEAVLAADEQAEEAEGLSDAVSAQDEENAEEESLSSAEASQDEADSAAAEEQEAKLQTSQPEEASELSVTFMLRSAGEESFAKSDEYSQTVSSGADITEPKPDEMVVISQEVNGKNRRVEYIFSGWFTDEACTTPATEIDFKGITENKTFWGKYELSPSYTLEVLVQSDDDVAVPLDGIRVRLIRSVSGTTTVLSQYTGQTGEDGQTATAVPGKAYFNSSTIPSLIYGLTMGFTDFRVSPGYVDGVLYEGYSETLVPTEGENMVKIVTLKKAQSTYRLYGTVTDESGSPVSGVKITFEGDPEKSGTLETTSASNGTYSFTTYADEDGTLYADVPEGYLWNEDGNKKSVSVYAADEEENIELERYATIAGTVTDKDTGQPLAGVDVTVARRLQYLDMDIAKVTTGDDGKYSVQMIPAEGAENIVVTTKEQYVSTTGKFYTAYDSGILSEVAAGASVTQDVQLESTGDPDIACAVEIPASVEVAQGGSVQPPAQSFDFEVVPRRSENMSDADYEYVVETFNKGASVVTTPAQTSGVGTYTGGKISIEMTEDAYVMISDCGLIIRQKVETADGWEYDTTEYAVMIAMSIDGEQAEAVIYPMTSAGPDYDSDPLDAASFTNTYTKDSTDDGGDDSNGDNGTDDGTDDGGDSDAGTDGTGGNSDSNNKSSSGTSKSSGTASGTTKAASSTTKTASASKTSSSTPNTSDPLSQGYAFVIAAFAAGAASLVGAKILSEKGRRRAHVGKHARARGADPI